MNYQGLMEITKIENIADDVYEMTLKGEGAKYISQPGQFINIKINESLQPYQEGKALLIGGGLGTPPLYNLGKKLKEKGVEVTTVLGFSSKKDVFYIDKFQEFGDVLIATMDGSLGVKGTVIDVIKKANLTFDHYYTCGPEPMLDALALNYPENGQLSFEARMGCGFGACMGCSCKVKTKPYKRICVEGPILLSEEVIVNG